MHRLHKTRESGFHPVEFQRRRSETSSFSHSSQKKIISTGRVDRGLSSQKVPSLHRLAQTRRDVQGQFCGRQNRFGFGEYGFRLLCPVPTDQHNHGLAQHLCALGRAALRAPPRQVTLELFQDQGMRGFFERQNSHSVDPRPQGRHFLARGIVCRPPLQNFGQSHTGGGDFTFIRLVNNMNDCTSTWTTT